jgi:hypothetical protein
MSRNERQTVARNNRWMFQACELGLPCKAEIRFRNHPFLAEIETA